MATSGGNWGTPIGAAGNMAPITEATGRSVGSGGIQTGSEKEWNQVFSAYKRRA